MTTPTERNTAMEHNIEVLARQRLALREQQESIAEKIAQIDALLVDAIEVGGSIDLDGHPVLRVQQKRTFSPDLARDLVPADLIEAATVPTLDAKKLQTLLPPAVREACMQPGRTFVAAVKQR